MGEKIIWTNGCFDVLHRGHIELFKYAKSLGTKLYVGIDTDEKVKRDKGESRPINNQQDRKFILESIKYIDKIFIFDSRTTLEQHIRNIKPNIMVIGSDWKGKTIVGEQYSKSLVFFDRIKGYSTTEILEWKN
jgi:rfaE bifunctional protein nucleotidyltransferase chain/domain